MNTLLLNGNPVDVTGADVLVFVGKLDVDVQSPDVAISWSNVPCPGVVKFEQLLGYKVAIDDCRAEEFESSCRTPCVSVDGNNYLVVSLCVRIMEVIADSKSAVFSIETTAENVERGLLTLSGQFAATYVEPIKECWYGCAETIPVQCALPYLPLLGLPRIFDAPDRGAIVSLFGEPHEEGGGDHPKYGFIAPWMRYDFPSFALRFQLSGDMVSHVTVMSRSGPLS